MKRLYIIIAAMIISISGIMAQPGPVQKMAKSVFTLTTFNKDGQIIASTQGVFIDNKGSGITTSDEGAVDGVTCSVEGEVVPSEINSSA